MKTQYTVRVSAGTREEAGVAHTLASLPESFRPAPAGHEPDVAVISGQPGWAAEAAETIRAGARGVVIVNPAPQATGPLQTAAEEAGAIVIIDQRWASNPAVLAAEVAVRSMLGRAAIFDTVATSAAGSDSGELLADHLAAVTRLSGALAELRLVSRGPHGYTISGRLPNGAPVVLQGILTSGRPSGVHLTVLTDDGGINVTLPEPAAAWPATVKVTSPQGELLMPTLYESAHRASWRRLKEHLDSGTIPTDLNRFAALSESLLTLS